MNFESDSDSTSNIIKTHVELRKKVGDFDFKVTPGATYQTEENDVTSSHLEGVVSSSRLRFQSKYQNFKQNYQNIFLQQSVVGQVKENLELDTSIDVHKNVRFNGSWTDTQGFRSEESTAELSDKTELPALYFTTKPFQDMKSDFRIHKQKPIHYPFKNDLFNINSNTRYRKNL